MLTPRPAVVINDLFFSWPDGTPALTGITAAFGGGRTGLIGDNGAGKSTLLKLIAGKLAPSSGTTAVSGTLSYLPQHLTLETSATVADLLGIRKKVDALRAIESGEATAELFDVIGEDWDVIARGASALEDFGLSQLDFDREVGRLSGGETILTAFAGLQLASAEVTLLDEPTNNLDRTARQHLYNAVANWRGALIVVSHDIALLNLMDETAELRQSQLRVHGGNYESYRENLEQEQQAAIQALRTAEQQVKKEERQRIDAQIKLARRERSGRKAYANKKEPKIVMGLRKSQAQISAGKFRGEADLKVNAARDFAEQQADRVREDDAIRIDLPDPKLPSSRRLAEFHDHSGASIYIEGPERVALRGRNGIGKTRLLEALVHAPLHSALQTAADAVNKKAFNSQGVTAIRHAERIGYVPQRLDHLDEDVTVLDTVRAGAPDAQPEQIRGQLARFLFRKDAVYRRIGELSGGERFRVALAQLLLAEPAKQLLIFDEPTNNLDLSSVDALVAALDAYRGALLVVSHDDEFLGRLRISTHLELSADGLHSNITLS